MNPRVRADPRWGIWISRTIAALVIFIAVMFWFGLRWSISVTVVYLAADIIFRSKTMKVIPPAARVTAAQRSTRRRLRVQQPAGYLSLHARTIPGEKPGTVSVIDHVVVGPAGVFVLDSQLLDRRLPIRAIGAKLYHGPVDQKNRLDHAVFEAKSAASKISAELRRRIRVQPVMIIYGPRVPWVVMTLFGVDLVEGGRVSTYFRRQSRAAVGRQLDAVQIAEIFAAASRALPPIEPAQADS